MRPLRKPCRQSPKPWPNVIWTALDELDLSAGAPTVALDPDDIALAGDVSGRYAPAEISF